MHFVTISHDLSNARFLTEDTDMGYDRFYRIRLHGQGLFFAMTSFLLLESRHSPDGLSSILGVLDELGEDP